MEMSMVSKIYDAAPRNNELVSILSETRYATRNLDMQKSLIARMDANLSAIRQRIHQLDEKRTSDLKKHKLYRDSVVKKLVFRLSGQGDEFVARAEAGQQQYFDVLQQERQAKEEEDRLLAQKVEALGAQSTMMELVERRKQAQIELDLLYDNIFHGPNPDFPEEDELELRAEVALHTYHCAEMKVQTAQKLVGVLTTAKTRADQALSEINEALKGGQLASSFDQKKKLEKADFQIRSMRDLMMEAWRMFPTTNALPSVDIRVGLVTSEAYDNPWGKMAVHERIRGWMFDTQACLLEVQKGLATAESRLNEACENAKAKSAILQTAKQELQLCRSEIFAAMESSAITQGDDELLPTYCDE